MKNNFSVLICVGKDFLSRSSLAQDGQCNENDRTIWRDNYANVKKIGAKCGRQCWYKHDCTSTCMINKLRFSKECAFCFGKSAVCGFSQCSYDCWVDTGSTKCRNCLKTHCLPPFEKCSGLRLPAGNDYQGIVF